MLSDSEIYSNSDIKKCLALVVSWHLRVLLFPKDIRDFLTLKKIIYIFEFPLSAARRQFIENVICRCKSPTPELFSQPTQTKLIIYIYFKETLSAEQPLP